jgi:hypothetical protein
VAARLDQHLRQAAYAPAFYVYAAAALLASAVAALFVERRPGTGADGAIMGDGVGETGRSGRSRS